MKKWLSLALMWLLVWCGKAQTLPTFSTEDEPVWYYIQFYTGSACIEDEGSGESLLTADKSNCDEQKWQLIGDETSFYLKSKAGNYVYYSTSTGYFTANSKSKTKLKLTASTYSGAEDCWEIQRKTSSSASMNQWGGTGAGKNLGEWTTGDSNNPLSFIATSIDLPEFSDDESETWYFISFKVNGYTFEDQGEDEPVRTAVPEPSDEQLWKLVGNQDTFQLVDKAGRYAVVSSTAATSESPSNPTPLRTATYKYSPGYSLIETENTTYSPAWEIVPNKRTGYGLNSWGGTDVGLSIGVWTAADDNNPVVFTLPDDMTYDDFKVLGTEDYTPQNQLTLWYTEPSTTTGVTNPWMEYSLPIGNGQFGASLMGGILKDEIQFNEKTLWSGSSTDNGSEYGDYENFGSVYAEDVSGQLGYTSDEAARGYYRQLDLSTATGEVYYMSPDSATVYTRQYIASNPDGVVAARYAAEGTGKLSLRFTLESGAGLGATTTYEDGQGYFSGSLETVSYNARFSVVASGDDAVVTTSDEGVTVEQADEVLLILGGGTDFDAYSSTFVSGTSSLASTIESLVDAAAEKGWTALYEDHVADYQELFDRVDLTLTDQANSVPTDELVDLYASGGTSAQQLLLEQLYFNYGRYLEISSSRGVDLPSNLQGIWNNSSEPPWNCDMHVDINVQMNYWPAEPTNLSETHLPLLNYIINMATNHSQWAGYASDAGQSVGWTLYTENNIFGGVGSYMHNYVIANAWLATHLWQHYRYTLDEDFLLRAWPALWGATEFWLERIELDDDGTYVCPDEYSPEHGPSAEDGTAHSQQIVWELFSNVLAAAEVLGDDCPASADSLALLEERFALLDTGLATELYTGYWGTPYNTVVTGDTILREWKTSSYTAGDEGHRHMSHLMCLYPFSQVTTASPYFTPAVNSMLLRGDSSTGWSMGWKINLWARAHDGDHAHTLLELALQHSTSYETNQYAGGIYYNLYDSHAPFQIDGNFGACAGMAEMLMQSASDTIEILPALPSEWAEGSVGGLKAVGDLTVSIEWSEGAAERVEIVNNQGQAVPVRGEGLAEAAAYVDGAAAELEVVADDCVLLPATVGSVVEFIFGEEAEGVSSAAKEENLGVDISGSKISVAGATSLKVYDTAGRLIGSAQGSSVSIGTRGVVIVEAVTASGQRARLKAIVE